MLKPTEARAEEARKHARDMLARDRSKEAEVVKEREKAFAAQAQKTAKLRALRLARDEAAAAEKSKAAAEAPAPKARPVKKAATAQKAGKAGKDRAAG